ncbi:MAG: S8 family serine peptidase, partial [Anaerolineae bacterium]
MKKTRTLALVCLILAALNLAPITAVTRAGPPGYGPLDPERQADDGTWPAFRAGHILVQFKTDYPAASAASLLSAYNAAPSERIGVSTYAVPVAAGQEEQLVQELRKDPAVASAMLDLRLMEPPLRPLDVVPDGVDSPASALASQGPDGSLRSQTPRGVITETLRMSTMPAGPALPDNTLPTESPQAYAVFDYTGLTDDPVRVQVYALDVDDSPIVVFDTVETLDGSGTASVVVPAWDYFVDAGTFPIGRYLTLVYESLGESWRAIGTVAWHVSTQPNDQWFLANRYQWNLHNTGVWGKLDADIDAPEAWDVTTGSEDITIAVVSTGVAMSHPDLKNKIWQNDDEIPGNGIDDDDNGYVDDVNGYEFFLDEDNPDPTDDIGWGTFAAGIAAAETNNQIGMAGVSWGARIMPIKVVRLMVTATARVPYGFVSDLIQGLHYAADNGAQVILVAPIVSSDQFEKVEALRQAVEYATNKGSLVIGVVGDQGRDDAVWPALFPEVLAVGATDYNDELTTFSNFGEALSDGLVAPGKLILSTCMSYLPACVSTYPQDVHGQTAWAAAQVAGVAS